LKTIQKVLDDKSATVGELEIKILIIADSSFEMSIPKIQEKS